MRKGMTAGGKATLLMVIILSIIVILLIPVPTKVPRTFEKNVTTTYTEEKPLNYSVTDRITYPEVVDNKVQGGATINNHDVTGGEFTLECEFMMGMESKTVETSAEIGPGGSTEMTCEASVEGGGEAGAGGGVNEVFYSVRAPTKPVNKTRTELKNVTEKVTVPTRVYTYLF